MAVEATKTRAPDARRERHTAGPSDRVWAVGSLSSLTHTALARMIGGWHGKRKPTVESSSKMRMWHHTRPSLRVPGHPRGGPVRRTPLSDPEHRHERNGAACRAPPHPGPVGDNVGQPPERPAQGVDGRAPPPPLNERPGEHQQLRPPSPTRRRPPALAQHGRGMPATTGEGARPRMKQHAGHGRARPECASSLPPGPQLDQPSAQAEGAASRPRFDREAAGEGR